VFIDTLPSNGRPIVVTRLRGKVFSAPLPNNGYASLYVSMADWLLIVAKNPTGRRSAVMQMRTAHSCSMALLSVNDDTHLSWHHELSLHGGCLSCFNKLLPCCANEHFFFGILKDSIINHLYEYTQPQKDVCPSVAHCFSQTACLRKIDKEKNIFLLGKEPRESY
jgi:hypothetical protein